MKSKEENVEGEMKVCRDKYWSECDDAMKIERMRSQVKRLQQEVAMLNKVARYLQGHSHTPDGSVVIPLFMRDEPMLNEFHGPKNFTLGDEVYF